MQNDIGDSRAAGAVAAGLLVHPGRSSRCFLTVALPPPRSERLEIPTPHRLPLAWWAEAASPPLVYRAYADVVPEAARDPERLVSLRQAVLDYKPAQAIARKQRANGLWGGNLLAPAASKAYGWTEAGTAYQYRRLVELGWPPPERTVPDADRVPFQLLSRIEPGDPGPGVAQRGPEPPGGVPQAAPTRPRA